jgi:hypothetical protein
MPPEYRTAGGAGPNTGPRDQNEIFGFQFSVFGKGKNRKQWRFKPDMEAEEIFE